MATALVMITGLLVVGIVIVVMVRADSNNPKRAQFRAAREQVRIMRTAFNEVDDVTREYREIESVLAGKIHEITRTARTEMEKHTP